MNMQKTFQYHPNNQRAYMNAASAEFYRYFYRVNHMGNPTL